MRSWPSASRASSTGDWFGTFLAAILPALVVFGDLTFIRLVEASVERLRDLRPIQRLR